VSDVLRSLARHPRRELLARWNWKSALLSACLRGPLFLLVNLRSGRSDAVRAMAVELLFVASTNGIYGAITQALAEAEPAAAAILATMVVVPALAHTLELVVHTIAGTPDAAHAVGISLLVSVVSAAFNAYAMRRGVLTVGGRSASLASDLRRLPRLAWRLLVSPFRRVRCA
jgi:hypothetical protein